jgi:hypothetical protein
LIARADVCWQCGAPADDKAACVRRLFAGSRRKLDAQGWPVKRGRLTDTVTVRVPRCLTCRNRFRRLVLIVFASTTGVAVVANQLHSLLWREFGFLTAIGPAFGFGTAVVAVIAAVVHYRRSGIRPIDSYPGYVDLRRAGWQEPAGAP